MAQDEHTLAIQILSLAVYGPPGRDTTIVAPSSPALLRSMRSLTCFLLSECGGGPLGPHSMLESALLPLLAASAGPDFHALNNSCKSFTHRLADGVVLLAAPCPTFDQLAIYLDTRALQQEAKQAAVQASSRIATANYPTALSQLPSANYPTALSPAATDVPLQAHGQSTSEAQPASCLLPAADPWMDSQQLTLPPAQAEGLQPTTPPKPTGQRPSAPGLLVKPIQVELWAPTPSHSSFDIAAAANTTAASPSPLPYPSSTSSPLPFPFTPLASPAVPAQTLASQGSSNATHAAAGASPTPWYNIESEVWTAGDATSTDPAARECLTRPSPDAMVLPRPNRLTPQPTEGGLAGSWAEAARQGRDGALSTGNGSEECQGWMDVVSMCPESDTGSGAGWTPVGRRGAVPHLNKSSLRDGVQRIYAGDDHIAQLKLILALHLVKDRSIGYAGVPHSMSGTAAGQLEGVRQLVVEAGLPKLRASLEDVNADAVLQTKSMPSRSDFAIILSVSAVKKMCW